MLVGVCFLLRLRQAPPIRVMGQERSLTQECFWSDSKLEALQDFPGGPVLKSPPFNAGNAGSIPGWGTEIPTQRGS